MTLEDLRRDLCRDLSPKYGEGEAKAMARIIFTTLKDWDFSTLLANENREASDYIVGRCREILALLADDVPLQYALGQTSFYGLKLKVGPGVLVPRPETEELVDLIVKDNGDRSDLRVRDLCTGSGAIAIALSRNLPFSRVDAVDVSPKALEYARENAKNLKAKINFLEEDIMAPGNAKSASSNYDIIVSNPPYVDESEKAGMAPNVLNHEPHIALFVPDDDPLKFYKRIADIGLESLAPGGKLYFEINPRHAGELKKMLAAKGYADIEIIKDVNGKDRFAKARKP